MASRDEAVRSILVAVVSALLGIGAVMIYSTTARGDGPLVSLTFLRQMAYVALGVCIAFAVGRLDYHTVLGYSRPILLFTLVLLVLVLVPGLGHRVKGAARWLRVGPVGLQPSELAKIALVIFLASFLGEKGRDVTSLKRSLLPVLAVTAVTCLLVLLEPDIGTCFLLGIAAMVVLFVAGARPFYLIAPVVAAAPVMLYVVSRGYARARIQAWLDPWRDPSRSGYQIIQSLIAIGSGGVGGKGLGASEQKLLFLPEAQNDFIFAILAEEMGLVGVTLVLLLYLGFAFCGIHIAARAKDTAGALLAAGVTSLVILQAIINIAVVTKVFPTKGIALPFFSTGGSSAVVMLIGVALLYSVARSSAAGQPQRVE